MALKGIDVSFYQGDVDWMTVASSGITFAFAKATEGISVSDPQFAKNWAGMRAAGIIRGAYHFFRPDRDPIEQANNFLRTIRYVEPVDLAPVLDVEITGGLSASEIVMRAGQWLAAIETAIERQPIIYTYPAFWESLGNPAQFARYPLWIANFGTLEPFVPQVWSRWAFHQYSETGTVQGVAGPVDLNQFNGTLDDLQTLLKSPIILRQGAVGQVVKDLQQRLNAKGFNAGTPDGAFGPQTRAAVIGFQQSKGLIGDGIVGPLTWTALLSSQSVPTPTPTPTKPQPTPTPTPTPTKPQPTPTPTPTPTKPQPAPIDLINVGKGYRGLAHQDQALRWLQGQIPKATLEEFARRWRKT